MTMRRNTGHFRGGLPYSEMRRTVPTLVRDVHDGARRIERIVDDLKHFRDRADEDLIPPCS